MTLERIVVNFHVRYNSRFFLQSSHKCVRVLLCQYLHSANFSNVVVFCANLFICTIYHLCMYQCASRLMFEHQFYCYQSKCSESTRLVWFCLGLVYIWSLYFRRFVFILSQSSSWGWSDSFNSMVSHLSLSKEDFLYRDQLNKTFFDIFKNYLLHKFVVTIIM